MAPHGTLDVVLHALRDILDRTDIGPDSQLFDLDGMGLSLLRAELSELLHLALPPSFAPEGSLTPSGAWMRIERSRDA